MLTATIFGRSMNNKDNSPNQISNSEEKGLLAEYESLRSEIIDGKGRRLQTMSLIIGAFGVILSIIASAVLRSEITTVEMKLAIAVGGGIALYGVLIPGLIMVILLQQSIRRVGEYIRIFIEPRVPGLNWQNRWSIYINNTMIYLKVSRVLVAFIVFCLCFHGCFLCIR